MGESRKNKHPNNYIINNISIYFIIIKIIKDIIFLSLIHSLLL